jgi:hypothetical protein
VDDRSGVNQNQPGADGIGDTPYDITYTNTDEYPLIAPVVPKDTNPPITESFLSGRRGNGGWYLSEVNFSLQAFDNAAGVNATYYRVDGGSLSVYTSRVLVSGEGMHAVEYYSIDHSNNSETIRVRTFGIDTERPQPLPTMKTEYSIKNTRIITLPIEFEDNASGIREYVSGSSYYSRGTFFYSAQMPFIQVEVSDGSYVYQVRIFDVAGNYDTFRIWVNSSLMVNREATSSGGPYGIGYNVGIIIDLILACTILWLSSVIRYGPAKPEPPGKQPGERDRADVENGYPKYMKRA